MKILLFILLPVFSFAQIERAPIQRYQVTNQPVIASSVQMLSFSATQGTASAAQSVVFSGVSGSVTVSESSEDFEISLSSGSGYTTSVSGAAPLTVYVRTRSAATAGVKQNMLTASFSGADNKYVGLLAEIGENLVKDTASFNFSLSARAITGFYNGINNPHNSVQTGAQNGISFTTRSTSYWTHAASTSAAQNAGQSGGGNDLFPANTYLDYYFSNQTAISSGNEHFEFSGLKPGMAYTVNIAYSRASSAVATATREQYYVFRDASGYNQIGPFDVKGNNTLYATRTIVANEEGKFWLGGYGRNNYANATYVYYNAIIIIEQ